MPKWRAAAPDHLRWTCPTRAVEGKTYDQGRRNWRVVSGICLTTSFADFKQKAWQARFSVKALELEDILSH